MDLLVLVLEASTTFSKAMLFDTEQGIIKVKACAYPNSINDIISQDTEGVYQELIKLSRDICADQKADAIALGGTWHNVSVCDRQMRPVTRTRSWLDTSASEVVSRLRADKELTTSYYRATGCMIHTTYIPFKLIHMKEQGLALADKVITDQGSYNFFRLTGQRVCTTSMASGMGLLNIHSRAYEPEVLKLAGISSHQLGSLRGYRDYGYLTGEAAREIGLPQGTPVMPAFPDGALNQVGANAMERGIMTLSVGTSAALRLVAPQPITSHHFSTWCYVSAMDSWLLGAATAGSCNCIDWVKKQVLRNNYSYRELEDHTVDKENMPIFLPFVYGERCPGWNDSRRGGYHELRPSHGASDLFISAMEGVLFNIKQCYDILVELSGRPEKIKVSGGVLKSPMWIRMLSDILDETVDCADMEQSSLLGGAIMAVTALDAPVNPNAIKCLDSGGRVAPDPQASRMHRRRYERYLALYDRE